MIVTDLEKLVAGREIIRSLRKAKRVLNDSGRLDRLEDIFEDLQISIRKSTRVSRAEITEIILACIYLVSILKQVI